MLCYLVLVLTAGVPCVYRVGMMLTAPLWTVAPSPLGIAGLFHLFNLPLLEHWASMLHVQGRHTIPPCLFYGHHIKTHSLLHSYTCGISTLYWKIKLLPSNNFIINCLSVTLRWYHLIKLSALTQQCPHMHIQRRMHNHPTADLCRNLFHGGLQDSRSKIRL